MKKTLLFSNVVGDIMLRNSGNKCFFNKYMNDYLKENVEDGIVQEKGNIIHISA